ncbi:hypothetical protein FSP39_015768 [Pinctada imbricata]|uniref:CCHC-type domain-containing protein n=1 Tax=Pinctada imbricata TaxID=66713 RepID=A0AA89BIV7_PINIB|nr:hypothetical protein FSP39_015768 [Pinctada imbricata]
MSTNTETNNQIQQPGLVDKNKMATNAKTFAAAVTDSISDVIDSVKPVFIVETDLFGDVKPSKDQYLTHTELYKSINEQVPASHLKGLQRVRGLWRIYLDNASDRDSLITLGLNIRGKMILVHSMNPRVASNPLNNPNHLKIRIKNVPCSAEDGQIARTLEYYGCRVHHLYRERLRVDGLLTNCQTGDRIALCDPVIRPLPRSMVIGKYRATVLHRDQVAKTFKCNKCYEEGHKQQDCPNDWICKLCHQSGHKQSECTVNFSGQETSDDDLDTTHEDVGEEQEVANENADGSVCDIEAETDIDSTSQSILQAPVQVANSERPKFSTSSGKVKQKKKTKQAQIDQYVKECRNNTDTPVVRKEKRNPTTPTDVLHTRHGPAQKSKT